MLYHVEQFLKQSEPYIKSYNRVYFSLICTDIQTDAKLSKAIDLEEGWTLDMGNMPVPRKPTALSACYRDYVQVTLLYIAPFMGKKT